MDNDFGTLLLGLFLLALAAIFIAICLLPYLIARSRRHAYRNIILVLCIFGIFGVPWVIALIWAIYPSEQSLIDPVMGNPTGVGSRNAGDTLGAVAYGRERGYAMEQGAPMQGVERPQSVAVSPARFCRSCGTPRGDGAVFCATCGEQL